MNKIKITNHQLFSLTSHFSIGGAIIVSSSWISGIAKQDAWISALLLPAFGTPVILMHWFLGSCYPNMTLIGMIKKLFGKYIGFIISLGFVFLCLLITCHLVRNVSNFVNIQGYKETPLYVLNLLFVITAVIALLYGLETIARISEISIYFVSILFFLTMILVLPNVKLENLQPVFENGIIPILKGSRSLADISTLPLSILIMIYPININNIKDSKKSLLKGYLWAGFILFIATLMPILVLGSPLTAVQHYPTFLIAKEVGVGIVFSRFEFIIAVVWIITQFMTGLLYFYAGVIGLSELFGLRDYKKIVIPLGLIITVMSEIVLPNAIYQITWAGLVWPLYAATFGLVLPILLLLISLIKNKFIS